MQPYAIRFANEDDAPALLAIYAPYVRDTTISFELEPPAVDEFAARISAYGATLPYLVCTRGDTRLGYAYASPYHARGAYRFAVETSIYLDENCRKKGIGRALYACLLELLYAQGYTSACAAIALPNAPSEALHAAMGFAECGRACAIGYKHGTWVDVLHMQKQLRPVEAKPLPTTPVHALDAQYVQDLLEQYAQCIAL